MAMSTWLRQTLGVYSPVNDSVSRSAFYQARMKLMPKLFKDLDDGMKKLFYAQENIQRWKNFRVVAMDGTSLITNQAIYADFLSHLSEQDLEELKENHLHTFYEKDQLHSVTLHNVMNDICLGSTVDFKSVGERELAAQLSHLLEKDMLITLDRGYPVKRQLLLPTDDN